MNSGRRLWSADSRVRKVLACALALAFVANACIASVTSGAALAATPDEIVGWGSNSDGQLGTVNAFGSGWASVSAGRYHSLGLKTDGTVWAWGSNGFGQLGNGTNANANAPVRVTGPNNRDFIRVSAGTGVSLALKADGSVWAWGLNSYGQLGNGTTSNSNVPVPVSNLVGVTEIARTGRAAMALKSDGTVWAWGSNTLGHLGQPVTLLNSSIPMPIPGLANITAISSGQNHSLALAMDGTVLAWGENTTGQLGNGSFAINILPTPGLVSGLAGVRAIAAGFSFSLALLADGSVRSWGTNYVGQLGNGTNSNSLTPTVVSGLSGISAIAAGDYHSLALRTDGTVRSWGGLSGGVLGAGNPSNSNVPLSVAGLTNVSVISAGADFSLVKTVSLTASADGIAAFGDNAFGQRSTPSALVGSWSQVAAGLGHSLGLRPDGRVWAWGHNNHGQLGRGTTSDSSVPVLVANLTNVRTIAAGLDASYAVRTDGTVWSWGANAYGQLGNGTTTDSSTPVQVTGLNRPIVSIVAGGIHVLALDDDAAVIGWGGNARGQLGTGTTSAFEATPAALASGAVAIAASRSDSSYFVFLDGTVYAWGANNVGQLGNGTLVDSATPEVVPGLTNVTAIAAGGDFVLARRNDGSVHSWGGNLKGQLGVGSTVGSATSVAVSALTNVASLAAGYDFAYARGGDGVLRAWGNNAASQLGTGNTVDALSPSIVPTVSNPLAMAAGYSHALVVSYAAVAPTTAGTLTLAAGTDTTANVPFEMPIDGSVDVAPDAFDESLPSVPIRHIPIRHIPIRHIPIRHIALGTVAARIPLARVPLLRDGGWPKYLAGTSLANTPLQRLTLADVLALPSGASNEPDVTLEDLDLSQSALADLSIASIALGEVPIDAIALTDNWSTLSAAQRLSAWCAAIAAAGQTCAGVSSASTVTSIDLAGVPIRHIDLGAIPIRHIDFTETPIRHIPIRHIALSEISISNSPIRHIPIRHIANASSLFDCQLIDCASLTLTLQDAFDAAAVLPGATLGGLLDGLILGTGPDVSLAQVLALLIDRSSIPWDQVPLDAFARVVDHPNIFGFGQSLVETNIVTGDFKHLTGTYPIAGTVVTVTLPQEWQHLHTSVTLVQDGHLTLTVPLTTNDRNQGIISLPTGEPGFWGDSKLHPGDSLRLSVNVQPGPQLSGSGNRLGVRVAVTVPGAGTATSRYALDAYNGVSHYAVGGADSPNSPNTLLVMRSNGFSLVLWDYVKSEPAPGDPATLALVRPAAYYLVQAPASGTRLVVSLTAQGEDADLIAYRPAASPAGGGPAAAPLSQVPVEADGGVVGSSTTTQSVPSLDGFQPVAASMDRGTAGEDLTIAADTASDSAQYYILRVSPVGKSSGLSSFRIFAREVAIADPGTCPAYTGRSATQGAAPTIPAGTDALILHAPERTNGIYASSDAAGIAALDTALADIVAQGPTLVGGAAVHPFVINVADLPGVAAAYDAWDAEPCKPAGPNGVVSAIRAGIGSILNASQRSLLKSITVVGGDDLIPQARLADSSHVANESGYVGDVTNAAGDSNPLAAAARGGNFLSDDPYADFDPVPWLDRFVYVPDLAIGRLVETPSDAAAAINQFLSNNGTLDPQTAHVAGYDFLADGSQAVKAALPGTLTKTDQIDNAWTGSDLAAATPGKDVVSLNAHFDHANLLPNASNRPPATSPGPILNDQALPVAANSIVFSMGCHSGLSVPDTYGLAGDATLDWAQRLRAQNSAVFVGNTGFGYGNSKSVALTEQLMVNFAGKLNGAYSVGQALMLAKQQYFAAMGAYGGHDEKALQESTFYGLPMWKITGTAVAPNQPAPPSVGVPSPSGLSASFITASALTTTFTTEGEFDQVVGTSPQVTEDQPVIARESFDITYPSLNAKGMVIEDLTTSDRIANAYIASPTATDGTPVDKEPALNGTAFPTVLGAINNSNTIMNTGAGTQLVPRQNLVLMRGQFFADSDVNTSSDTGTMRRINNANARVYYADPSDTDRSAPEIMLVSAAGASGSTTFTVRVAGGATRVLVLARTNATDWTPIDLSHGSGDTWSGSIATGSVAEYFVQAVDASGNVSIDMNKGVRYSAGNAPVITSPTTIQASDGVSTVLNASFADNDSRAWASTIDWGEGSGAESVVTTSSAAIGEHLYRYSGSYTAVLKICDEGDRCATKNTTVNVGAVTPTGPQLSISDVSVLEGDGPGKNSAKFSVSLSAPDPTQAITVRATTVQGTAASPADFTAINNKVLTIKAGKVSATLTVPITPDSAAEGNESFAVVLTSAVNASIADDSGAAVIIDDDGVAGTLKLGSGNVVVTEGNATTRTIQIPVAISRRTLTPISFNVHTTAGTATGVAKKTLPGGDFVNRAQTLTFQSSVVLKQFTVTLLPDVVSEGDETFSVVLTPPPGYVVIGSPTVTVTIRDDD